MTLSFLRLIDSPRCQNTWKGKSHLHATAPHTLVCIPQCKLFSTCQPNTQRAVWRPMWQIQSMLKLSRFWLQGLNKLWHCFIDDFFQLLVHVLYCPVLSNLEPVIQLFTFSDFVHKPCLSKQSKFNTHMNHGHICVAQHCLEHIYVCCTALYI